MDKKEIGFILKRFLPQKQKLSIFCRKTGKIEAITSPQQKCFQLWPGMLVSCNLKNMNQNIYFLQNIEILMNPEPTNSSMFYWIHNILEICYYFVPLEKPSPNIFNLIYNFFLLYKIENIFLNQIEIIRQIYVVKLLELEGFYPDKELLVYLNLYNQLTSLYVDFDDQQKGQPVAGCEGREIRRNRIDQGYHPTDPARLVRMNNGLQ